MLINELNENFYYACIKYTLDNSNANVVGAVGAGVAEFIYKDF